VGEFAWVALALAWLTAFAALAAAATAWRRAYDTARRLTHELTAFREELTDLRARLERLDATLGDVRSGAVGDTAPGGAHGTAAEAALRSRAGLRASGTGARAHAPWSAAATPAASPDATRPVEIPDIVFADDDEIGVGSTAVFSTRDFIAPPDPTLAWNAPDPGAVRLDDAWLFLFGEPAPGNLRGATREIADHTVVPAAGPKTAVGHGDSGGPEPAGIGRDSASRRDDFAPEDGIAARDDFGPRSGSVPAPAWELFVGERLFPVAGAAAVAVGVFFLLARFFLSLGPWAVGIGIGAGAAALAAGFLPHPRGLPRAVSAALPALGWAILYVTVFAAYHVPSARVLHDPYLACGLLASVGLGVAFHSSRTGRTLFAGLAWSLLYAAFAAYPIGIFSLLGTCALTLTALAFAAARGSAGYAFFALLAHAATALAWMHRQGPDAPIGPALALVAAAWTAAETFDCWRPAPSRAARTAFNHVVLVALVHTWIVHLRPGLLPEFHRTLAVLLALDALVRRAAGDSDLVPFRVTAAMAAATWSASLWLGADPLRVTAGLQAETLVLLALSVWLADPCLRVLAWLVAGQFALRIFAWDLPSAPLVGFLGRRVPATFATLPAGAVIAAAIAALAAPRTRVLAGESRAAGVAGAVGVVLLLAATGRFFPPATVPLVWALLGWCIAELGHGLAVPCLRFSAALVQVAAVARLWTLSENLFPPAIGPLGARLATSAVMLGLLSWQTGRITASVRAGEGSPLDSGTRATAAWLSAFLAASILAWELPGPWLAASWSILAVSLLGAAATYDLPDPSARPIRIELRVQALAMSLAATTQVLTYGLDERLRGRLATLSHLSPDLLAAAGPFALAWLCRTCLEPEDRAAGGARPSDRRHHRIHAWTGAAAVTAVLGRHLDGGALSLAWAVAGIVLVGCGFVLVRRSFRGAGIAVLALAAGKVLFVDLGEAAADVRILAYCGLGLVLLAVSWGYARFESAYPARGSRP